MTALNIIALIALVVLTLFAAFIWVLVYSSPMQAGPNWVKTANYFALAAAVGWGLWIISVW